MAKAKRNEGQHIDVKVNHTYGYDSANGEFCLGIDGVNLDGEKVENLYLFFTDEQMEDMIKSYKRYVKDSKKIKANRHSWR